MCRVLLYLKMGKKPLQMMLSMDALTKRMQRAKLRLKRVNAQSKELSETLFNTDNLFERVETLEVRSDKIKGRINDTKEACESVNRFRKRLNYSLLFLSTLFLGYFLFSIVKPYTPFFGNDASAKPTQLQRE